MRVAIAGHQNLDMASTASWITSAIEYAIVNIPITKGYTCLAKGADQLFADILIKKNVPFVAIIASSKIEASFKSNEDKKSFKQFLAKAADTIKLPFDDLSEEAYYEAGKTAVDQSELLIAVWDGLPAKGLGGTGDVVKYALRNNKRVIHIDLKGYKVIELHSI